MGETLTYAPRKAETLHAGQRGVNISCRAAGAIMTLACSAR